MLRVRLEARFGGRGVWIAAVAPIAEQAPAGASTAAAASSSIVGIAFLVSAMKWTAAAAMVAVAATFAARWIGTATGFSARPRSDPVKLEAATAAAPGSTGGGGDRGATGTAPVAERQRVEPERPTPGHAEARVIELRGIVRDASGRPVPGTVVFLANAHSPEPYNDFRNAASFCWCAFNQLRNRVRSDQAPQQESDGEGRFRFLLQGHGKWNVGAIHPQAGFAYALDVRIREDVAPSEVELVLDRGVTLFGVVTDELGAPIARARLSIGAVTSVAHSETGDSYASRGIWDATTDDSGRYSTAPLPVRDLVVDVSARSWFTARALHVSVAPHEVEHRLDASLNRSRVLHGHLVDATGAIARLEDPSLGALTILATSSDPAKTEHQRPIAQADLDREHDAWSLAPDRPGTSFLAAFSGNVRLGSIAVPESGDEVDIPVDLSRLPDGTLSHAAMEPLGVFIVVVRDDVTKQPIGRYSLSYRETTRRNQWGRSANDEAGRYRSIDLAPGRIDLVVNADGYVSAVRTLQVVASVEPEPILIEMRRGDASLGGHVVDLEGHVLADAHVFLLGPDGEPALPRAGMWSSDGPTCEDWTEDDGRFRFDDIPRGDYLLVTEAGGFAPTSTAIALKSDRGNVELRVLPGVNVTLKPVLTCDVSGVPELSVHVRDERGALVIDDHRGKDVLTRPLSAAGVPLDLAPGRYSVEVTSVGFRPGRAVFTATAGAMVSFELRPEDR
jgi:hypothetical protein